MDPRPNGSLVRALATEPSSGCLLRWRRWVWCKALATEPSSGCLLRWRRWVWCKALATEPSSGCLLRWMRWVWCKAVGRQQRLLPAGGNHIKQGLCTEEPEETVAIDFHGSVSLLFTLSSQKFTICCTLSVFSQII